MLMNDKDRRLEATETIWKHGVVMLVASIPFVFLAKLILLPVFVVVLAALSTMCVWMFGGSKPEKALNKRLAELEERLMNVETMSRVEMQMNFHQGS
ncbi:MAG: hypothetical protein ACI9DF_003295 [Verrucomicrobiales bacterium]|jgi:membrane protein implicated in regulation of membrane protease activity